MLKKIRNLQFWFQQRNSDFFRPYHSAPGTLGPPQVFPKFQIPHKKAPIQPSNNFIPQRDINSINRLIYLSKKYVTLKTIPCLCYEWEATYMQTYKLKLKKTSLIYGVHVIANNWPIYPTLRSDPHGPRDLVK